MAKMLKQLVLGQKKNPPAPPRPDYADKLSEYQLSNLIQPGPTDPAVQPNDLFIDHDYENFPKFKSKVHFMEKREPEVVLFENYSEPADLRSEALEADPLYMSPFDSQGCAEEDMYCLPYEAEGYASQQLGRKTVLLYTSPFYVLGWLAVAYAPSIPFLYAGRLTTGLCAGICSVAVPAYIVEVSTVEVRGFLTAGFQVAFSLGVLLVMAMGAFLRWSWLAIVGCSIVVTATCLINFMPESPSWLVRNCRDCEALLALRFLRGRDSDVELKEIKEFIGEEPVHRISWREFLQPGLYRPTLIAVALMFFQQFSGINALMSYAVELFQGSRVSIDSSVAAIIAAVVQVVGASASSLLIDNVGRRTLYAASGICMGLNLLLLGVYSYWTKDISLDQLQHWGLVPVICFALYILSYSVGFGPIPFVVIPELVPTRLRSLLLAIGSMVCSFFGFVVTKVFADMQHRIGLYGIYWTYCAFSIAGFAFYCLIVPETKGRTVRDIHRQMSTQ